MTADTQPIREHEHADRVPEASGVVLVLAIVLALGLLALLAM